MTIGKSLHLTNVRRSVYYYVFYVLCILCLVSKVSTVISLPQLTPVSVADDPSLCVCCVTEGFVIFIVKSNLPPHLGSSGGEEKGILLPNQTLNINFYF